MDLYFFRLLVAMLLISTVETASASTDKYRCMWRDDPATTMTIGWNQISGTAPTLYYDLYDCENNVAAYSWSQTPDRKMLAKEMNNHFVRLTGLQPNATYYFIIADSEGLSRRLSFKTAPDNRYERLSIIAGGDSRNHRTGRKNANKLVSKLRPHCVMFGGDMTGSDKAREWKYWFDDWQHTIPADGHLTPLIVARGNHEYSNTSLFDLFDVENPNIYYALNLGGDLLRVYTLNSLIATGGDQRAWLETDLASNQHMNWIFAQYHFAIRPHTRAKREHSGQYKNWAKNFHKYGVDLVTESDIHVVKTTWPIRPSSEAGSELGFIRDDQNGTVYVGEGCWGAPLRRDNDDKSWTRNSGSFNQFKWIFVSDNDIEVRTVKTDNADAVGTVDPYDIFTAPAGLEIWEPSNGSVLTINKRYDNIYATQYPAGTSDMTASLEPQLSTTSPAPPAMVTNNTTIITRSSEIKTADKVITKPEVVTPTFTPANILNCKASLEQAQIAIKWQVQNETAQKYRFEIQRAKDGKTYQTIARMQGIGPQSSKLNSYRILDKIIDPEALMRTSYQILVVDPMGGQKIYPVDQSETMAQQWAEFQKITPDPSSGILKVRYQLAEESDVHIQLTGFNNKLVSQSQYNNQKTGNYLKSIDMLQVPKGVYLLTIKVDDQVLRQYHVLKEQRRI